MAGWPRGLVQEGLSCGESMMPNKYCGVYDEKAHGLMKSSFV